jgi:hypothetical protein
MSASVAPPTDLPTQVPASTDSTSGPAATAAARGPLRLLLDLFSSVRLGVTTMAVLFVYSSIGSAGIFYPTEDGWAHDQIRQWRPFEMTEFEWFHWWPFDLMMIMIAINLSVATIRRIPFKPVNYGVWTIHIGILIMMLGCWIYFGTKIEGDAPVVRRMVTAELVEPNPSGGEPVVVATERFIASPGQRVSLAHGTRRYELEITEIDPEWMMRSEGSEAEEAYSVQVMVRRAGGSPDDGIPATYMRQVLAGHPEHTEDVIPSGDPTQPMQRAIKAVGKATIDPGLRIGLDYKPAEWYYLRMELEKAWALYLREPGATEWVQRPIHGLPLYNDYIADRGLVIQDPADDPLKLDPISVAVPASDPADPAPGVTFSINGFLRYAFQRTEWRNGPTDGPLNPLVDLVVTGQAGERQNYRLLALDPRQNKAEEGIVQMRHILAEDAFAKLLAPPTLRFRIADLGADITVPVKDLAGLNRDAPFQPLRLPETAPKDRVYSYRVIAVQDDVPFTGGSSSVAVVEIQTPLGAYRRWVFSDPSLTRDVTEELLRDPHAATAVGDPSIEILYEPGHGQAFVMVVSGPEPNRLRLISALTEEPQVFDLAIGRAQPLPGGLVLTPVNHLTHAISEQKPLVVPREQRERDAGVQFAQAYLEVPGVGSRWIRYHPYVFDSPREVLRRFPYQPEIVTLSDGRKIEVMFSRQRLPLPAEIALEEFVLTTHIGGFTGEMGSIRDYTSRVRFRSDDAPEWTEPAPVSMNAPLEHAGLAYFQSQWDPPDQPRFEGDMGSRGLNYTVLGVGNRNGVWTMLWGCIISVIGMCYAFYVKPVIKRRQREAVYSSMGAATGGARAEVAS